MSALSRQEKIANCVKSLTGKPDFPSFSQHVQAILAAVDHDEVSPRELTGLILRDYSLSLTLLRKANARNFPGRQIVSITHAVALLGTETVRRLAAGLRIFEHVHDQPAGVRELMTLSLLSANHVRELARRFPDVKPEEAYLCGLVRNVGEVLTAYYLPAEYARILKLAKERRLSLSTACLGVLLFTFEDLGGAITRYWGMPDRVVESQRAAFPMSISATSANAHLLAAVSLGHSMTAAVYRSEPEAGAAQLKACLEDHYPWLPLKREEVDEILAQGIRGTQESLASTGIRLNELRLQEQTRRVLEAMNGASGGQLPAQVVPGSVEDGNTLERLTKEVCALVNSDSGFDLNTLILMVLEALFRGAGFGRVIFAFVNQDRTRIEGRIGLGEDADELIKQFKFRMSRGGGPVSAALIAKRSVVADAKREDTSQIGPLFGCACFGLYPVVVSDRVVGCIFMESRKPRPSFKTRELRQFDRLRDALVSAFTRLRSEP